MAFTLSPNMSLTIPGVGTEAGPTYAFDVNSSLTIIDQHNHSNGSGVQINPSGLNINTSLPFNNNFATNIAGLTLTAQISTPSNGTVYKSGNDLYYINGAGLNIQLTNSSGIVGTPGSISNLSAPASATYVSASSTFVWQSNTSIAANLDAGSLLMRNLSPNSTFALTLQPPASLGNNYSITLPAIPGSQSFVTLDTSGNLAGSVPIANGITRSNLAAVGQVISTPVGVYTNSTMSYTAVTNLQVVITTTGRPVIVFLQPDATSGHTATINLTGQTSTSSIQGNLKLDRDGTQDYITTLFWGTTNATATTFDVGWPVSTVFIMDTPVAGTHTYTLSATCVTNNTTIAVAQCVLAAYEL